MSNILKTADFKDMSQREIEAALTAISKEPGGMEKIASLALEPIQEDVLYKSKGRQIFAQKVLEPGEEAVLDGDVRVPGCSLSVEGLPYQVEVKSNRVRIDTAPISVKALVKWNELNYRKFDMLDWTQARAKSSLLEQEDSKAISVLEYASTQYNQVISSPGKLYLDAIADAASVISDNLRTKATKLIIPAGREKDLMILQYANGNAVNSNPFTPETNDEIIRKGVLGNIYGLEVISIPKKQDGSDIIDPNTCYVVGPAELVGVFVVRSEIMPKTQTDLRQEGELISFWEDIGIYCRYSKGICKIDLSAQS